jgi:hypothetical protein
MLSNDALSRSRFSEYLFNYLPGEGPFSPQLQSSMLNMTRLICHSLKLWFMFMTAACAVAGELHSKLHGQPYSLFDYRPTCHPGFGYDLVDRECMAALDALGNYSDKVLHAHGLKRDDKFRFGTRPSLSTWQVLPLHFQAGSCLITVQFTEDAFPHPLRNAQCLMSWNYIFDGLHRLFYGCLVSKGHLTGGVLEHGLVRFTIRQNPKVRDLETVFLPEGPMREAQQVPIPPIGPFLRHSFSPSEHEPSSPVTPHGYNLRPVRRIQYSM